MKKSKLQKRKDNPRSKYYLRQADALWGKTMHRLYDTCAVNNGDCAGKVEAHHLIHKHTKSLRHDPLNCLPLCTWHHVFSPELSAHGAPIDFAEWLKENRYDKWKWVMAHKNRVGVKPDYQHAIEVLKGMSNGL